MATFVGLAERGDCQWDTFAEDPLEAASRGGVGSIPSFGVGGVGSGGGSGAVYERPSAAAATDRDELRTALEALSGDAACYLVIPLWGP